MCVCECALWFVSMQVAKTVMYHHEHISVSVYLCVCVVCEWCVRACVRGVCVGCYCRDCVCVCVSVCVCECVSVLYGLSVCK